MTTPSPYQPVPSPYGGATPTGALLRPSPMGLGDVFSSAFELYKRRWQLFVGIALIPAAAVAVAFVAYFAVLMGLVARATATGSSNDAMAVVGLMLASVGVFIVAMLFITALQYQCYGMITLGALDLANGQNPTFAGLRQRTRGLGWRVLGVVLAIGAVAMVAYGVLVAALVAGLSAAGSGRGTRGSTPGGAEVLLVVLFVLLVLVVAFVLTVRWLYFVPVLAVERTGGFAALKRSWQLTSGNFWRTFGFYFMCSLLVGLPSGVLSGVAQSLAYVPGRNADPAALMVPMLVIVLLSLAISVFTAPFTQLFLTVMYVDQVNRANGAVAPAWGGQPAWGAATTAPQVPQAPPAPQVPWTPSAPPAAPYGQQQAPYGQQQAPYGQQQAPYGQPAPFAPPADPYAQQPGNPWGAPAPGAYAPPPAAPDETPEWEVTRRRSDLTVPPPHAWTNPEPPATEQPGDEQPDDPGAPPRA